jgi:hypothetical protein
MIPEIIKTGGGRDFAILFHLPGGSWNLADNSGNSRKSPVLHRDQLEETAEHKRRRTWMT